LLPFPELQPKWATVKFPKANGAPPCIKGTTWSTDGASLVRGLASHTIGPRQIEHGAFDARADATTRARSVFHRR
jgi:hypothetical protein